MSFVRCQINIKNYYSEHINKNTYIFIIDCF